MISFIVPTIGRPTLARTLSSIERMPGDEILIVGDSLLIPHLNHFHQPPNVRVIRHPAGNDWGATERNYVTAFARGQHLAHIDDDDVYLPGTRALMAEAIGTCPAQPTLFRMQFRDGTTLWGEPKVTCGNVGTPMFLIPNRPTMLGTWGSFVGGDCHFLETMKWTPDQINWRPEIIAQIRPS